MSGKPTLYELLRVTPHADAAELQAAYQRELRALEAARAHLQPSEFADRSQLLRLALSTLSDPVTRLGYDNALVARAVGAGGSESPAGGLALMPMQPVQLSRADAAVRAEALSLRADALALRADALLARAASRPPEAEAGGGLGGSTVFALKYVLRAAALVFVALGVFAFMRMGVGNGSEARAALDANALEKTALQEYYLTHGVRPANMAELELLETERRRRANATRADQRDRDKEEHERRDFEEESRRRGELVSDRLRAAEQQQQYQIESDRQRAEQEAERKRAEELYRQRLEQQRIQQERESWRATLRER